MTMGVKQMGEVLLQELRRRVEERNREDRHRGDIIEGGDIALEENKALQWMDDNY